MDKKLISAIVLSFLIMFVWSGLTTPKQKNIKIPDLIDNNEVKETKNTKKVSFSTDDPSLFKKSIVEESINQAENNKLALDFTNIGGNLKKATIKQYEHTLPISNILNVSGYENQEFKLEESARNFVSYIYQNDDIKIIKRYQLNPDDYTIISAIEVTNMSEMSKQIDFSLDNFIVSARKDNKNARYSMLLEYNIFYNNLFHRKKNLSKFSEKENNSFNIDSSENWTGFRDQYFCAIVDPTFGVKTYETKSLSEKSLKISAFPETVRIEPGNKVNFESVVYIGPQDNKILKRYNKNYEKIIDFRAGGFVDIMAFGQTDRIARVLLGLLNFLHRIIPNWGITIILFAFVIYGVTYPLTQKSMSSMKKMQSIQPKVVALKEKHKDNPQKMNKEMMELYKKHKVNPFGGCLPIFLQMPIFISLYQLLWRSYSFKGASFLWINDLSEPDRLFKLPITLPYIGNEFNILPLFYAGLMVLQQKFQSKNMAVSDPSQAEMQKMMSKIFPVMLGFIFYKFASGLTLYFTVYFLLTTITQWKMSKTAKVK